ncbi:MAG: PACE efflux transporter [Halomonas sp.]|nr:PACE efflux transporter [Halomonas sp.]MDN6298130.1 PACE efflux transporter [Halomonas sp.]MDN6315511.1 PACE efflux transporter [Halomonas sp.]MDN6336854.1 PACE efflux transporter [Halomonas sp.]
MRTVKDRIRHAISFEILGILLVIPLGAWLFDKPMHDIGVVAVVSATIATCWNYLYNLGFDHAMQRLRGDVRKTIPMRVFHALLFETGLLIVLLPFIAWYLGVSMIHAFQMDISFALFYVVYAFVFNWAYDVIFPVGAKPLPVDPETG